MHLGVYEIMYSKLYNFLSDFQNLEYRLKLLAMVFQLTETVKCIWRNICIYHVYVQLQTRFVITDS